MSKASAGVFLTLTLAFIATSGAQEVQFIDLTSASQRVALRFPHPAPSQSGTGFVGGGGGGSVGDCAPDIRDPHAAAVYLDGMDGKKIDPARSFEAEFRFVNSGRAPITVPISPDLSDLQPADPTVSFSYLDLGLAVRVRSDVASTGYVRLYGSVDHGGTTRVLKPGEWIRVKANLMLNPIPASCDSLTLVPGFWMHNNRFQASSRGFWEDSNGICVNEIPIMPPTAKVLCEHPPGGSN